MNDEASTENALEDLGPEDAERMKRLLLDLLHMDRLAKREGHSLVELLAKLARDSFGIDIRPSHDAKHIQRQEY